MAKCGDKTFSTFVIEGVGTDKKSAEQDFESKVHDGIEAARKKLKCGLQSCEGSKCTFVHFWAGPKKTEKHSVDGLDDDGDAVDIDDEIYVCTRYLKAGCFCVSKKHIWL